MARDQDDALFPRRQFFFRKRLCLIKDCEQSFYPSHPGSRYCGSPCQAAARRWSQTRAQKRYRVTERGKKQRNEQSRRYRVQRKKHSAGVTGTSKRSCEGDQEQKGCSFFCSRPGCYELVHLNSRSPLQKYCSSSCRRAVWRVIERERHWLLRISMRPPFSVSASFD